MIKVLMPISLKRYTDNKSELEFDKVETIMELLRLLASTYPQLKTKIFSSAGELHPFINAFVDGKNIRQLQGESTILTPKCEVMLVAAIAGG